MTADEIERKSKEWVKKLGGTGTDYSWISGYTQCQQDLQVEINTVLESAKKWEELKKRLSTMLENYTGEERDSTMKQEIITETHWIVTMLTKYEVNW